MKKGSHIEITSDEIRDWLGEEQAGLPFDRFALHLNEVLRWNKRIPLVSRRTPRATLKKLLRRSVSLMDLLERSGALQRIGGRLSVVDVGTGGGFPGVVWKLSRPSLELAVVERSGSKADFLVRLKSVLGVEFDVIDRDVRDVASSGRYAHRFDIATAMAVAPPHKLYEPIHALLKTGGFFATIRGYGVKIIPETIRDRFKLHAALRVEDRVELLYRSL